MIDPGELPAHPREATRSNTLDWSAAQFTPVNDDDTIFKPHFIAQNRPEYRDFIVYKITQNHTHQYSCVRDV
jgi:hypothetical protein